MPVLYFITVKLYGLGILISSLFNGKAKKWVEGRAGWQPKLKAALEKAGDKRIHFHCPSLGEFEQGKPVLRQFRKLYPDHFIILTFFSPSGYELRKNDPDADHVCYLPLDGPANAKKFLEITDPEFGVFVKYDFWFFFIRQYHRLKVPLIFISSIFRPEQVFFRWYGSYFRKMLCLADHLFVQDRSSLELLNDHSVFNVSVSGDTRFDRVHENAHHSETIKEFEDFSKGSNVLVAGSTWEEDEKLLTGLMNEEDFGWKVVIAPHEISERTISRLQSQLKLPSVTYSGIRNISDNTRVIIIDNVGMLSRLFRYGKIAYIGGGFGSGIHNILEPAVFGLPVIFGPRYGKFREARELVEKGGGFPVSGLKDLRDTFNLLAGSDDRLKSAGELNSGYINSNRGATAVITEYIKKNFSG